MLIIFVSLQRQTIINVMNKDLLNDFNAFRLWFNRMFSLSLNGKFKGLCSLKDWKRFAYRLYKELNGYFLRPSSDVICMRVSGQTIKLYNR